MKSRIPSPGFDTLYLVQRGAHYSAGDGIFVLSGDASAGNAVSLTPAPGVGFPLAPQTLGRDGFRLSIYHINDLHGHLARFIPSTSSGHRPQDEDALISRIAWQIRSQRKALADCPDRALLFFSAGDDCIGAIFDELLGTTPDDFQMHAAYRLYSALGMDAACLGNHEFDIGFSLLREAIQRDARFPLLAANVSCPQLENICHPAAIFVVKGIRVGVIGLVTQAELNLSNPDCRVTDPVPVAQNLVSLLRPYCDVLVILSHLGLSLSSSSIPMQSAGDVELAQSLPRGGVQLIIGGHTHHSLNLQGLGPQNIVNGIPIVQAGSLGHFLGRVELMVTPRGAVVTDARLLQTEKLPIDADFDHEFTQPVLDYVRCLLLQELGTITDDPQLATDTVRSFFASTELPLANFVTDALVSRLALTDHPVDLALVDASVLRRGLEPGSMLTFGDWFNIMPFADTLRIYHLTGRQLHDLLQDNAQRVNLPGEPHTERGFLHFSKALRYAIVPGTQGAQYLEDARQPCSAVEILLNGIPLKGQFERTFRVAAPNFVRELAGVWEKSVGHTPFGSAPDLKHYPCQKTEIFLRREMLAHIKQAGGVTREAGAVCDGRLRILEPEKVG
jgi:5'-nucleotidase / UDP-sugar diphosphatase